jgi:predicted transcriptional regulator
MTLADLVERLHLKVFASQGSLGRPVTGGLVGDLLSDVMAHGRKDDLWVTIQVHPNIVAVAVLKDLAAILIAGGREPAAETVRKAESENVPLLGSPLGAFTLVGRLTELGVQGT